MRNLVILKQNPLKPKSYMIGYLKNRIKQNKNFMGIFIGETGCLSGDTKLFGQTKILEELYNSNKKIIKTVSLTKQNMPVKSVSELRYSGIKKVYELELEDGKKVFATSEHRLFKRVGRTFNEVEVKNLEVGNKLRVGNLKKLEQYWQKRREYSKHKIDLTYSPKKLCSHCNNLFYVNRGKGLKNKGRCHSCSQKPQHPKNRNWKLWEKSVIQNFYGNHVKNYIMDLLPGRKWDAIQKQAESLHVIRQKEFQYAGIKKSNLTNNPSKWPEVKLKRSRQMKELIKKHPNKFVNNYLKRNKITKCEMVMKQILINHFNFVEGKDFFYNQYFKINKSYKFPDFVIPKYNLIIECDGEYWHKNMKMIDKERDMMFENEGYKVLRFSDTQLLNNEEGVKECLAQELNQ